MKNRLLYIFFILIMFCSCVFSQEVVENAVPVDAKLEFNHGIDFYKLGRYGEAIASFRTAIRLYPDYISAYYNLGSILEYLKQYDEALSVFEQIIARDEKEYEALYHAAKISANLGDRVTATKYIGMISKSSEYYQKSASILAQYGMASSQISDESNKNQNLTSGCYPNITSPTGVTTDKKGNLYVSSFTDNAIFKVQPDGKKMIFFKNSHLNGPISLACDDAGNIYVANYNANNVLKLSSSGACTVLVASADKPYGLHVSGKILFVACQGSNSILRVKLN